MDKKRKECFDQAKRVVVKVGSNVLTTDYGLNIEAVKSISGQIGSLVQNGLQVLLVSSGAMASGFKKIGISKRPDEIPERQAAAAIGQAGLIREYEKAFGQFGINVAQILLTGDGLANRRRYLNARNTLNKLLSWNVVPIINENDTVVTEEIKLGDNDNLAAMITLLMDADILINLTDIEGLFDKDPRKNPDAKLIPVVSEIKREIELYAGNIPGPLGTGGMLSKITAAKKVTSAGISMVIAKGEQPEVLQLLFSGEENGTFFMPGKEKMQSRKCWIAFTLKPKGILIIDNGASEAIVNRGKSLLPSGIVDVEGAFDVGAPVEFIGQDKKKLGMGLVNYSANDIRRIMGQKSDRIKKKLGHKSYDEVIHRDNLTITDDC